MSSRTLKEAFEPPYRGTPLESFSFGPQGIADNLKRERLLLAIEIDVELSERTVARVEKQIAEMRSGNGGETRRGAYVRERQLRYRLRLRSASLWYFPRRG